MDQLESDNVVSKVDFGPNPEGGRSSGSWDCAIVRRYQFSGFEHTQVLVTINLNVKNPGAMLLVQYLTST